MLCTSRVEVTDNAVRQVRKIIHAGGDISNKDLRVVIEERLEEVFEDPYADISLWVTTQNKPFTCVVTTFEDTKVACMVVQDRDVHVCTGVVHYDYAKRLVANRKWRTL